MGRDIHVSRSEHIIKYPQRFDPDFVSKIQWNSDNVVILVYILQDGYCDINLYMDEIPYLLDYWVAEDCMDAPSIFNIRESYAINLHSHYNDDPMYMQALTGDNSF